MSGWRPNPTGRPCTSRGRRDPHGRARVLAEEDGDAVGFVLARRKEGTRGLLSDIYVRPEARRQGHATRLASAAADALHQRGATHMTLSVHVANAPARAAYERWGFRERTLTLDVAIDELRHRLSDDR